MKTGKTQQRLIFKELRGLYKTLRPDIEKRLEEFRNIRKKDGTKLFSELCFCLLTPQSRAKTCWEAVVNLNKNGLLFKGSENQIKKYLKGVRFKNNKAKYINNARKQFPEIKEAIRKHEDVFELREWLVKNICGFGYKEASHFLRNIGLGDNIAILDRHILRNLVLFGVIKDIPTFLTKAAYLDIEEKMRRFSGKIKIPLSHLDLLLWAKETGGIFK